MKHNLKISVSQKPKQGGIVACRNITIREKILNILFGEKQKLTILVPGGSVNEIAINEINEGGNRDEQNKRYVSSNQRTAKLCKQP